MPAHILRQLLRISVESLLPEGAIAAARATEASERSGLMQLAAVLEGGE